MDTSLIKNSKLTRDLKATIVDVIRRQQRLWIVIKGFASFYHKCCLLFFKNEIRKKLWENIGNGFRWHNPTMSDFPMSFRPSFLRRYNAPKRLNQPINQTDVGIANINLCSEINACPINLFGFSNSSGFTSMNAFIAHCYASFSIYHSSKIGKLCWCIFHSLKLYHNTEVFVHRERLNLVNPKGYAIV